MIQNICCIEKFKLNSLIILMTESQIKTILQRAKHIHKELRIPSQLLQNKLQYIKEKAVSKSSFIPCGGCVSNKSQINTSFRRAFNNFNEKQKAQFYLKNATIIREVLDNNDIPLDEVETQPKKMSIYYFNQSQKQWETRQTEVNMITKIMTFKSTKEEIDFHNYIIRTSKKKDKQSLALESIESFQVPQIMRISNNRMPFQQFKQIFYEVIDLALKQNITNILRTDRKTIARVGDSLRLSKRGTQQFLKQGALLKSNQNLVSIPDFPLSGNQFQKKTEHPPEYKAEQIIRQSAIENGQQRSSFNKPISEYEKLKRKLINSLTNNAGLQQFRKNVLFDLKENRIRKIYQFKQQDYNLPLQWFEDNMMICSSFKRWKKTLKSTKLLRNEASKNFKIFSQKHRYKNNAQISYLYKREKIDADGILYFLDTLPENIQNYQPTSGTVEYCIWKFERNANMISIAIEGKIIHDKVKLGHPTLQLTDQYMGQMDYICTNVNMTLLDETDFNINSILFQEQYLSQIDMFEDVEELSQFYTIKDDSDDDIKVPQTGLLKSISNMFDKIKKALTVDEALNLPDAKNRLKFTHPNKPYQKMPPKYRLPLTKGQNPYWQGQWQFNHEGQMISVNEQKIKAQSGVLKSIVKSLAKNVFSGKSILNMSLPVVVFSKESNLSLLCKSYAYAPLLLERAAKQTDPVHRLKNIAAFGISCNVAYIQMDKPFNPILGETYQVLIDGCPVLGEQTSHHPPISSTFMKGRGYTLYGNFQAKVNLGINTATGSNDGYAHVSFDENNYSKNIVKFNFPPGQISGLTFGDRKLAAVQKSYYIDVENMLFLQLNFSKHKGSTQYCKYIDGVEGKIVELLPGTDLSKPDKINKKSIKREYGTICGRWTKDIYYEDQLIFDSWVNYPYICEQYPCPLESDAFYRKDLRFKCEDNIEAAQTAKEELEQIQRNDRKLRKKYTGKQH